MHHPRPKWLALNSSYLLSFGVLAVSSVHAALPALPIIATTNIFNITNAPYNAVHDGVATNTAAIQQAINDASAAPGGGIVEIPAPGTFLTGPLTMKSKVNLQVDTNATLQFLAFPGYNGAVSPFGGTNLTDIEISGSGTIDGQGATWWSQGTRPVMLFFTRCVRILIQDVTLQNPPKMHIAFKNAAGEITIQRIRIATTNTSPNTDGIDLIGTNCLIQNCYISSGDDNIAVGSSAAGAFAANIVITNCRFGFGHGVSLGSNTQGGVSNMTVVDCVFTNTDNGIRMKSDNDSSGGSGQGGIAQNLSYYNIRMTNVGVPVFVYSYYDSFGSPSTVITPAFAASMPIPKPIPATTAVWKNIVISNLVSTYTSLSVSSRAMLWGKTELWITNFSLMNSRLDLTFPFRVYNAQGVRFLDSQINAPSGSNTFLIYNAGITVSNSVASSTPTTLEGLAGTNSLSFTKVPGATTDPAAIGANPLSITASTFTVSNNLTIPASAAVNFGIGSSSALLAVQGNLSLNGPFNISDGGGINPGTYTVSAYTGSLSGSPKLGAQPQGFTCVLDTNTIGLVKVTVYIKSPVNAWGYNNFGQSYVVPSLTNAIGVAGGGYHTLVLMPNHTVTAWGDDYNGQCDVPAGLTNVIAVAAGAYHSLALRSDGKVFAWGDDSSLQCDVPSDATNIVAISGGDWHSLALRADGKVIAWGDDSSGQIDVPANATNIIALSAGSEHSLALKSDGTVLAWGANFGPSGTYAGQIDVPGGLNRVVSISAGGFHSLALREDGTVFAWGDNSRGQSSIPASVTKALAISGGRAYSLAILSDGSVAAWGDNLNGQCSVPSALTGVTQISAGNLHGLALTGHGLSSPVPASLGHQGNKFQVYVATLRGGNYFLQSKNSLTAPAWTYATGIVGDGTTKPLIDPAPLSTNRVYRLREQ